MFSAGPRVVFRILRGGQASHRFLEDYASSKTTPLTIRDQRVNGRTGPSFATDFPFEPNHAASVSFNVESFIARRYLRGAEGKSEGRRFLRLITWISIGGVAVGVAALILALSIVRGFSGEITDKVIGFASHVQVQSIRDEPLQGAAMLSNILGNESIVSTAMPIIQEFVLIRRSSNDIDGVSLQGVGSLPDYISSSLLQGTGLLEPQNGTSASSVSGPGIVIGATLARQLGAEIGEHLTAFSIQGGPGSGARGAPRVKQFVLTGIFETSLANFDELYVFVGLSEARSLLEYGPDEITRFDVRVNGGVDYTEAADLLDSRLDFPAIARPVTDIYRSLFAWVSLQQSIIPMIISIIVFVAAVNVIGTLLMIILEKNREMGILASMGATAAMRQRIFVRLGLLIGASGVVIGEVIALVFALLQMRFGIIPLPAEAYYMNTAPIDLNPVDFIVVAAITLVLCTASSWIPARHAAKVLPIHAIRTR